MIAYTYTQQVDYPLTLQTTIIAAALSSATFDHIDTLGTGSTMLVSVWFDSSLSGGDQTTLNSILAAYTNPTDQATLIIAITAAIQTDANLMLVLRARVTAAIPTLSVPQLQQAATLLGIPL